MHTCMQLCAHTGGGRKGKFYLKKIKKGRVIWAYSFRNRPYGREGMVAEM